MYVTIGGLKSTDMICNILWIRSWTAPLYRCKNANWKYADIVLSILLYAKHHVIIVGQMAALQTYPKLIVSPVKVVLKNLIVSYIYVCVLIVKRK